LGLTLAGGPERLANGEAAGDETESASMEPN
jgi:hypothetical protein